MPVASCLANILQSSVPFLILPPCPIYLITASIFTVDKPRRAINIGLSCPKVVVESNSSLHIELNVFWLSKNGPSQQAPPSSQNAKCVLNHSPSSAQPVVKNCFIVYVREQDVT